MSDGDTKNSTLQDGHTAILVVHGVGQQNKFETVSGFASGLLTQIESRCDASIQLRRELVNLGDRNESMLRITWGSPATHVDIYEYYYQHKLQRQVDIPDVINWLLTTARRIRVIYETANFEEGKHAGNQIKKVTRNKKAYVRLRSGYFLFGVSIFLKPLYVLVIKGGGLLMPWLRGMEYFHPATRLLSSLVIGTISTLLGHFLRDFAGDVTAYTAYDPKLKLNTVRTEILDGCAARIKAILEMSSGSAPLYDRFLVAGHSLGSVVAYDSLSAISKELVTGHWTVPGGKERITGLVTFGSPLDKIAFLFWPLNKDQLARMHPVRYRLAAIAKPLTKLLRRGSGPQPGKAHWLNLRASLQAGMVPHFHGLRARPIIVGSEPSPVKQPLDHPLDHVEWLNFFHPNDLIAGHLDAYLDVENICTRASDSLGLAEPTFPEAHSFYWYDPKMMNEIIDRFLLPNTDGNSRMLNGSNCTTGTEPSPEPRA